MNAESEADARRLVAGCWGGSPRARRDGPRLGRAGSRPRRRPRPNRRAAYRPGVGRERDAGRGTKRAKTVGAIIRRRRESRGISLRAFARQCGLSPAHVSKIERGLASPSLETLTRIVKELDLHGANLFGRPEQGGGQAQVVRAADTAVMRASTAGRRASLHRPPPPRCCSVPAGRTTSRRRRSLRARSSRSSSPAPSRCASGTTGLLQAGDTLVVPSLVPHSIRVTGRPGDADRLHHLGRGSGGRRRGDRRLTQHAATRRLPGLLVVCLPGEGVRAGGCALRHEERPRRPSAAAAAASTLATSAVGLS